MSRMLEGLNILVVEDEFLIAMDVEQLCLDHGAANVILARNLEETVFDVDAAILDLELHGLSTLGFAAELQEAKTPFIFTSGYTKPGEVAKRFPDVALVVKPYSGKQLIAALTNACGRAI